MKNVLYCLSDKNIKLVLVALVYPIGSFCLSCLMLLWLIDTMELHLEYILMPGGHKIED